MFGWWDSYAILWLFSSEREQYKGGLKLLEDVASDSLIVGLRRSVKIIEKGEAKKAVVATDIAPDIYDGFLAMCKEFNVPVETVPSKSALGKACHIDVDASVVVVKKQS